ncbi:hypothetical protein KIPE111705_04255 [Kibdelosporangium persicum]
MRAAARVSRFRLLLVLLLVLTGVSAPTVPGAGQENPDRHAASAISVSVSAALPDYEVLHDRPRGSVTTGQISLQTWSDTWWAVCLPASDGVAPPGRLSVRNARSVATVASAHAPRSSRAPPTELA